MALQPIVFSDNGFIFRRFGPNDWRLVYAADIFGEGSRHFEDQIFYGAFSCPTAPAHVYAECFFMPVWSEDGGLTWNEFKAIDQITDSEPSDFDKVELPFHGSNIGMNGLSPRRDEDGYVWGISRIWNGSGDYFAHKSINSIDGIGHQEVFNWTNSVPNDQNDEPFGTWVSDGWIWWLSGHGLFSSGILMLHRTGTDGNGYMSFETGIENISEPYNLPDNLQGWPGVPILVGFEVFNNEEIVIINISDPDNPTFTLTTGLNDIMIAYDGDIQNAFPVNENVAILHIINYDNTQPQGVLYRTDDGGATWEFVYEHNGLASAIDKNYVGNDNEVCSHVISYDNPDEIWIATAAPYVFHSLDAGLTWEVEEIDITETYLYDNASRPWEWTSIALGATCEDTEKSGEMQPILGSDNGFIFRRFGENDWRLVSDGSGYDGVLFTPIHSFEDEIFYDIEGTYNSGKRNIVFGVWGSLRGSMWSEDGGITWEFGDEGWINEGTSLFAMGTNGGNFNRDEDGYVYALVTIGTSKDFLGKSTDYTGTVFENIVDITGIYGEASGGGHASAYVTDGYLWWTDGTLFGGNTQLRRIGLNGEGYKTWTLPTENTGDIIQGNHGSHALVCHGTLSGIEPIIMINISDPDNPIMNSVSDTYMYNLVGEQFLSHQVFPISPTVAVSNMWNDTNDSASGLIIRTDDGGATWTIVHHEDEHLGNSIGGVFTGFDNEVDAFVMNPANHDDIWCVGAAPYVFHSIDGGLTWTEELVDTSEALDYIADPGSMVNGGLPREWCSIAIASVCPSGGNVPTSESKGYPALGDYTDAAALSWQKLSFP